MAEVYLKIGAYSEQLKKELNKAKGHVAKFTSFVKKHQAQIKAARMKAGLLLAGEVMAVRSLVKAYGEQEAAEKKLGAVLRSTGHAAGYTAGELKDMAKVASSQD